MIQALIKYIKPQKTHQAPTQDLNQQILETNKEILCAQSLFNTTTDPYLTESAIYKLKSLECYKKHLESKIQISTTEFKIKENIKV